MKYASTPRGIGLTPAPPDELNNKQRLIDDIFLGIVIFGTVVSFLGLLLSLLGLSVSMALWLPWAALCVGGALLFRRWQEPRKLPLLLVVGGGGVVLWLLLCRNGFALCLNAVKDLYGTAFSQIASAAAVKDGINEALAVTLFFMPVTLTVTAITAYMVLTRSRVLYGLLLLILLVTLIPAESSPHWLWYVFVFLFLSLAILVGISGIVKASGPASALFTSVAICGGVLLILSLCGLSSSFEKPAALVNAEASFHDDMTELRYGRDTVSNFPQGDLTELDSFVYREDTALEITMTTPESLYLRGFVGSSLEDNRWQPTDKTTLYEYADLFYWLHEDGFYATSQAAAAVAAAGEEKEVNTITVKNVGAGKAYVYAPYELTEGDVGNAAARIGDVAPNPKDYEDTALVTYDALSNVMRDAGDLATTLNTLAQGGDADALAYLNRETAYRKFAYATALDIPKSAESVLLSHFGEPDLDNGHVDYEDAIQAVYDKLLTETTYNEECGPVSPDTDFLQYFLEGSAEGYSVHYATAAALILRYQGIPARYVEGYVVTPEDVAAAEGNTVTIDGGNSHAWVEYYRDGVGWVPLEVTPPYLYIMEQPDSVRALTSDLLDSNGQSGMLNMDEDNFEEEDEEEEEEEEAEKTAPWLVALILFGVVVLLAAAAVVVLILRRRKALEKRRQRIATAAPREAVDLLFREALALLFAVGIEKKNGSLDDYETPIRALDEGMATRFAMVCALHRESRFSDHPFSTERKNVFDLFRKECETYLHRHSKRRKVFVDKYIKNLY